MKNTREERPENFHIPHAQHRRYRPNCHAAIVFLLHALIARGQAPGRDSL